MADVSIDFSEMQHRWQPDLLYAEAGDSEDHGGVVGDLIRSHPVREDCLLLRGKGQLATFVSEEGGRGR